MGKNRQIEQLQSESSDPKLQEAVMLLKRKNVKYRPLPRFKGGCKDC